MNFIDASLQSHFFFFFFGIILGRHFNDFYRLLTITVINKEMTIGSDAQNTEYLLDFEIGVH